MNSVLQSVNAPPQRRGLAILSVWAMIVAAILLWQGARYSGVVERIAEWEYHAFGSYFPTLTFVALVAMLTVPVVLFLAWVRRRDNRKYPQDAATVTLAAASRMTVFWFGFAGVCASAAIGALIMTRGLPSANGASSRIELGTPADHNPAEGPASLVGTVDTSRIAKFVEHAGPITREVFIAPVVANDGTRGPLRYFTVMIPDSPELKSFHAIPSGILLHEALPGEVMHLYANNLIDIAPDPYLLLPNDGTIGWRYWAFATEAAGAGLVTLLFGFIVRRTRNRLRDSVASARTD